MAADIITIIKGDLGHIFVLWMNFVCCERRSTDPEMAAPICLVFYLKPNGAEIQMSVVGRMSAYGTAAANRAEHAGTAPSVQRKGLTKCPGGALTGIEPDANQRCDRNNPTLSCTAALRWTACARRPAYPSAAAEDGNQ